MRKLKCVQFDQEDDNLFTIFYCKEAKNISLSIHYQDVEKEFYPIPIADCSITPHSILHVDTESLRRAVELMRFVLKSIPSNLIEAVSFANMNKAYTVKEDEDFEGFLPEDYDNAFNNLVCNNDLVSFYKIQTLNRSDDFLTEQEKMDQESALSFLLQDKRTQYPNAEKFSIKCHRSEYSNMIKTLVFRAVIKEDVAWKHFEGYKDYTSRDAIQAIFDRVNSDVPELIN